MNCRLFKNLISRIARQGVISAEAERAFSIIEVIISISILTIGLAIAVPATIDSKRVYGRSDAISLFMSDIGRAQNRAISKGCRIIFMISDKSYSYGCDYLPYQTSDYAPDTVADYASCADVGNDDCKVYTTTFDESIEVEPTAPTGEVLFFNSKGLLVDEAGSLSTEAVALKMIDRQGGEEFYKFADLNILATGIVTFNMVSTQ